MCNIKYISLKAGSMSFWFLLIREVFWWLTWLVLLIVRCPYGPRGPPEQKRIIDVSILNDKALSVISNIWKLKVFFLQKMTCCSPDWVGLPSWAPLSSRASHEPLFGALPTRSVNVAIWSWVLLNPQVKHKLPWTMLGLTPSCIRSQWESLHLSLSEIHISIRANNITRSKQDSNKWYERWCIHCSWQTHSP